MTLLHIIFMVTTSIYIGNSTLIAMQSKKKPRISQQASTDSSKKITHLAIIPDGNRRWAKHHKRSSLHGHKKGMQAIKTAVTTCIHNTIKYLSLYTFSLENINRSSAEKRYLFNLIKKDFKAYIPEFIEKSVCVRFIGDREKFPAEVLPAIEEIEEKTAKGSVLQLNLLFFYGAEQEVEAGLQIIAQQVENRTLHAKDVSLDTLRASLWTVGIPNPELIIRTGNTTRLSNFLLLQAAYSELMFLPSFWPDTDEALLQQCIDDFSNLKRNFGH